MIPFVTNLDVKYASTERLSPLVARVTAQNPGPFTYTGTGVFIIGKDEVCIIDPGPLLAEHQEAIDRALDGKTLTHVFVTHHHVDHSPLAKPLAQKHGCKVYGFGLQPRPPEGGEVRMEAGDDLSFKPDIEIRSGDVVHGKGWTIEAIHTPGHTSNHMCYALREENTLFSGDHIMGWSTSVVSPPDGNMGDYMRALLDIQSREFSLIRPTHGPVIADVGPFVSAYIDHRLAREQQIIDALGSKPSQVMEIVETLYTHVDKRLYPAAALSVLSHLIYLHEKGQVTCDVLTLKGTYAL